jgi:hypothetical protein
VTKLTTVWKMGAALLTQRNHKVSDAGGSDSDVGSGDSDVGGVVVVESLQLCCKIV